MSTCVRTCGTLCLNHVLCLLRIKMKTLKKKIPFVFHRKKKVNGIFTPWPTWEAEQRCGCEGRRRFCLKWNLKRKLFTSVGILKKLTMILKLDSFWGLVEPQRELHASVLHWSIFTGYTQTGFSLMFNNLCLSNEADNLVEAVLCYS